MSASILEAFLNGLWQSALLAGLTVVALGGCSRLNAATRYWIWYAVLLASVALSLHPFLAAAQPVPSRAFEAATLEAYSAPPAQFRLPLAPLAGWFCALWAAAALAALAKLIVDYLRLLALKRASSNSSIVDPARLAGWQSAAGGWRRPGLRESPRIRLPLAAGLWRPAVLFPPDLRLSEREAFQIWLHEAAHFRRWDDWTHLLQKTVEAVFLFHPVVRWIGRQLDLEREIACDDFVCSYSGDSQPYAECLVRLAALRASGPAVALGAASNRKQIFRRIEMLLNRKRNANPLPVREAVLFALALIFAVAGILSRVSPLLALDSPAVEDAQEVPPVPPLPPAPPEPAAAPAEPSAPAPPAAPRPMRRESRRSREMTERLDRAGAELHGRTEAILRDLEERMEKLRAEVPDERILRDAERQIRGAEETVREVERQFQRQERDWERTLERAADGLERLDRLSPPPPPPAPAAPAPGPEPRPARPVVAPPRPPAAPAPGPEPRPARPAPAPAPPAAARPVLAPPPPPAPTGL